jgi:integrase/recombinase XerD
VRTRGAGRALQRHIDSYLEDLQVRNYSLSKIHGTRLVLELLSRFLRGRGVSDVRRVREEQLTSFCAYLPKHESWRLRAPLAVSTQRYYIGTVRAFFAFLEARGVILRSPADDLQQPRAQRLPRGVLTVAQARRLMAAPNVWTAHGLRDAAMLEVFYGTGIRLSECLNLALSDLDLAQGLLLVRNGKGKKDRVVPVPAQAAKVLDRYLRDARPLLMRDPRVSYLFLSSRGRRLTQSTISAAMHGYGGEAGIPWKVSPHILRHTCATHLLQGGADVRHVQKLLGHQEIDTTAIYTRVAITDLRGVVARAHPREALGRRAATTKRTSPKSKR